MATRAKSEAPARKKLTPLEQYKHDMLKRRNKLRRLQGIKPQK